MVTKEAFMRGMHARLNEANLDIELLIAREDRIDAAAYAEYTHHINTLRHRCNALQRALEKFQACHENGDEAKILQSSVDTAWEILAQTLASAREHFL